MDNAGNLVTAGILDANAYLGLTEIEKDRELQKSIMRMRSLIATISCCDTERYFSE